MEGIEHDLGKMRILNEIDNTLPPELLKKMAQGVRKISDSTPVEESDKT